MGFSPEFGLKIRQKSRFLMEAQARTGVSFDKQLAEETLDEITKLMQGIEDRIAPQLPEVSIPEIQRIKLPKLRFKKSKDGMVKSKAIESFEKKHNVSYTLEELTNLPDPYYLNEKTKFNLYSNAHQIELKKLLMDKWKWRPMFWNYKVGADGKPLRNSIGKIKTTPKFQDKGMVCPNIEALGEQFDFISDIVKWTKLKHRRGVLKTKDETGGWLSDSRVIREGRISARSGGLTNTLRQRHAGVCNVPKPDVYFGDKLRAMMKASDGMVCVGYDASSLEDMIKGHYAFPYDGGEYARKVIKPDYDAHTEMQEKGGLAKRSEAKPVNYGLQYNQKAEGLAECTGWSLEKAKEIYKVYWELNYGWGKCQEQLKKHWTKKNKRGIVCPISGLFLRSRSESSLGSLLIQHTGAFIMDYSGVLLDRYLGGIKTDKDLPYYLYKGKIVRRVAYVHDEYLFECEPEIAEDVLQLGIQSIKQAGKNLKLRVELGADGEIGRNWKDVH